MRRLKKHSKGFTLIEVLVSIAMVGILFLPMLTFFSTAMKTNVSTKSIQRANSIAESVMEEVKQQPEGVNWETKGYTLANGKYTKVLSGSSVEMDGKPFTAEVVIDPSVYSTFNSNEVPVITSLGTGSTVIGVESESYTKLAIDYFKTKYKNAGGGSIDTDTVAKAMRKTIKLKLDSFVDYDDMATLHIYEEYSIDSGTSNTTLKQIASYCPSDLYYGNVVLSKLKGVYIFYNYDVASTANIFQGIDVETNVSLSTWEPFKLYALCQKVYDAESDANKATTETEMNDYTSRNTSCQTNITTTGHTIEVFSNFKYSLNGTGYTAAAMANLVSKKAIANRLSQVTVTVYEGDHTTADENKRTTLVSTRGE